MTQQLQTELAEWIVGAALAGKDDAAILTGVCERLGAAGVPVLRVSVSGDLLDPILDGRGVRWKRGQGAGEEVFTRTTDAVVNEDWKSSPFFRLVDSGSTTCAGVSTPATAAVSSRCSTRCRTRARPTTRRSSRRSAKARASATSAA